MPTKNSRPTRTRPRAPRARCQCPCNKVIPMVRVHNARKRGEEPKWFSVGCAKRAQRIKKREEQAA